MYAHLAQAPGNLFFSPYSISSALAMTYAGVRGETATQMAQALHFSVPNDTVHAAYAKLSSDLNAGGHDGERVFYQLAVANALWGERDLGYSPDFLSLLRQDYDADLHQADFIGAPDRATSEINQWVKQNTQGKIPQLFTPGSLGADSRLVLVNAIYFKANWENPFDPAETEQRHFDLDELKSVIVSFMHQDAHFAGMENDDLQAVELPYVVGKLSMVILLPRAVGGLAALEANLNKQNVDNWLSILQYREVDVVLPKFTMDIGFGLADILRSMGIVDAFGSSADFSGITKDERLYLTRAIHKAYVEVDEEGTEAAAATGIVGTGFGGRPPEPPPMIFRADHPFLFLIQDRKSGTILFMGRVTNPQ
jgi:serpin B